MVASLTARRPSGLALVDIFSGRRDIVAALRGSIFGVAEIDVRRPGSAVVLCLTLEPWEALAAIGYPVEQVRVVMWPSGRIIAVPCRGWTREWKHRVPLEFSVFEELCLWDPGDPRGLRWSWSDGLEAYVTVVHRHLQAEEFWRRHRCWPAEDAPHGDGPRPIRSAEIILAARRWAA